MAIFFGLCDCRTKGGRGEWTAGAGEIWKGGSKRGFRQGRDERGGGRTGFVNISKKLNLRQKGVESPRIHHKGCETGMTGHFRAIDQIAIYCPFGRRSGAVANIEIARSPSDRKCHRAEKGRSILEDLRLRRGSVWLSESYRNARAEPTFAENHSRAGS